MPVLTLILGLVLGALAVWLALRGTLRAAGVDRERLRSAETDAASLRAALEHERVAAAEKLALVERAQADLDSKLEALCAKALKSNNTSFLELAKSQLEQLQKKAENDLQHRQRAVEHVLTPIKETLQRFDGKIGDLERARTHAYSSLTEQVRSLAETQKELRQETSSLVTALRSPITRGRWGEMQLRRVVEAAGMLAHCDFAEQVTATDDGRRFRPDLIVKLAGGKNVVVDAKAPLQAYLEAHEAKDEATRTDRLAAHARQIRDHVVKLSAKGYWAQFEATPEFVVLFIPGETIFSAALEQDPELIEEAARRRVILATPTTLIAVLWAIAHGWREERIAENAKAISELGRELHTRLATLGDHVAKLGRSLDTAVRAYNDAAGSLESRVFVTARRFKELGATTQGEIKQLTPVEQTVRPIHAPELVAGEPPAADAA